MNIFKELMNTDFRPSYIYSFNAKYTTGNIEKIKIINEGLRIYPDNSMLNNQLLFCLEDEEKEQHPESKTTGGYLKNRDNTDACIKWWDELSETRRNVIRSIPNFDANKFYEITGIRA